VTPQDWLEEQRTGRPGSPKRLYWDFKECFGSSPGPFYKSLEFMKLLTEAVDHDDLKFFDKLKKGVHQFVDSDRKTEAERLVYFLPKVHEFLSNQKAISYYLQTRRRLAAEMSVLARKFGEQPLPLPKLPESLQMQIDEEAEKIYRVQNWTRLEKRAGVPKVPPAPSSRPSTRGSKSQS
jgi:hypothetical protein